MSKTLARQIRRIGLLPTTYKESTEIVLTHAEDGTERATEIRKKTPIRHREELTLEELRSRREQLIKVWRAKRAHSKQV